VSVSTAVPSSLMQVAEAVGATRGRALQLRSIFDQSLIPMIMVDNQRRFIEVNAAARLLARTSLEEIRRLRIDDFTAPEDLPGLHGFWAELIQRESVSGSYDVTFPDLSCISLVYSATANALPGLHLFVFVPAAWPCGELEAMRPAREEPTTSSPLSDRQVEVLRLVSVGATAGEIADELFISTATVRTHIKNILGRLGAHNRAHAVALAMTRGLLGKAATANSG
jgi:DNA-binding CsgD family transcriptional regulator